jgi:HlyD family secretion protein
MDIALPPAVKRKRRIKRLIIIALILIVASVVTLGLSHMRPAAPTVDKGTVWVDAVKRGEMIRQVHGNGTLVPEEVRWIPATREGLVEQVNVRIGDQVKSDTVLMVLNNPDLRQTVVDAELQLRGAEADLAKTKAELQNQLVNQQVTLANAESAAKRAQLQAEADAELLKEGLIGQLVAKLSRATSDNLIEQAEMEKKKIDSNAQSAEAQISAQEARVEQFRAAFQLKKNQVDELDIKAGANGVVQQLGDTAEHPVQVGQRVMPGIILAKIAEPGRLKAELKIAETQVKDVAFGQMAQIDTRNGVIPGKVVRIDPAAVNGTVTVDVQLEGELPRGARPDLSVDGTIEIERLADVLYVGRPAYGQQDSTVGMFKLTPSGEAVRVQVKLGRVSVNTVEIVEGLQLNDQVILSDMSNWDAVDRVRLN